MHHSAPTRRELEFLPAMFPFSGPTSLPEFELGPPSAPGHPQRATTSWETRCLRKHRRRVDDEGCLAKRRRLMVETEVEASSDSTASSVWPATTSCPPLATQQATSSLSQAGPAAQELAELQPAAAAAARSETESSCMEVEAAQRKLQEIENRITLEDDDEDEDLDVEPAPRRPVLVISDSLKEGLQRGISDILPHTVAQSVSHSCMELVLWRPPEDPFSRRLKGSLQKQRKQQTVVSRQPPSPGPSPSPSAPSGRPTDTRSALYGFPVSHSAGEEDMEM